MDRLLRYFEHGHLAPDQAAVSHQFSDIAHWVTDNLPAGPETTVALRKLLEAKDAAVRASLDS